MESIEKENQNNSTNPGYYNALFEHSLTAQFIIKPDGSILDANQTACKMFGYSIKEFRELGSDGIIDPDNPGFRQKAEKGSKSDRTKGELTCIKKNREKIHCNYSSILFKDSRGVTKRSIQLIEKTKSSEAEQMLRNIVENTTNLFYTHDRDGVLTYISPQSKEFLGYEPEEAMVHWTEYITDHPLNKKGEENTRRALNSGEAQPPYELQLRKADGSLIWVEVNEAPVLEDGEVVGITGSLTDITDRKKAEQESEQNRKLLEGLAAQAWAAVWVRDNEGRHIFVNHHFKSLFGMEDQAVAGKTLHELFDKETAQQFRDNDRKALKSGTSHIYEEWVSTADGERYYRTNTFPLIGIPGHDKIIGGVAIDITDQKKGQEFIENSLREKDTLLGEIHHRVKNNMAIISGLLEFNIDLVDNEQTKEFIRNTQLRIQSMAKVHELLYRSDSFSHISFKTYILELISAIQSTYRTEEFDPQFEMNIDDIYLNINQAIPCGLLLNELITNSLKHAFPGKTTGIIKVTFKSQDDDQVYLGVEDDGIGISKEIFQEQAPTFGMTLINIITRQLKAEIHTDMTENGFNYSIIFERKESSKGSSDQLREMNL